MKILFTVEFYYPHVGGAENVVQKVAEGMAAKGHEVVVVTSAHPKRNVNVINKVSIVEFNIIGNSVKGIYGDKNNFQQYLRNNQYDILVNYAAQTWCSDLCYPILNEIDAKKVFIACGFSGLAMKSKRLAYFRYYLKMSKHLLKYNKIIYHTSSGMDKQFGDKQDIKHYQIIPNGIELKEFLKHRDDFKTKHNINSRYLLVTIGNHYTVKNHGFMIRALSRIQTIDLTFVILGQDYKGLRGCYNQCRKRSLKSGGKIRLLNDLQRDEICDALKQADLFLFSSKFEYAPIVLIEAMAAKTPFVSTDVGNARDLEGGIIIKTPKQMAIAVDNLLGSEEIQNLGERGYQQVINSFLWKKILNDYEKLFLKLL